MATGETHSIIGDPGSETIKLVGFETINGDNTQFVFHYAGRMETLQDVAPKRGTIWDEPSGPWNQYTVVSSSITREECEMGELTVQCCFYEVGNKDGELVTERYEVQFAETTQPLAFHPDFPKKSDKIANGDSDIADEWKKFLLSPEHIQIGEKYLEDPSDDTSAKDVPDKIKSWVQLYNKGIQQFMVYLPVVVRVSTYEMPPSKLVSGVGKLETPPDKEVIPQGFDGSDKWLKTGDNYSQESGTGKWTRTETWTYAHEWPKLLYSKGSSGSPSGGGGKK